MRGQLKGIKIQVFVRVGKSRGRNLRRKRGVEERRVQPKRKWMENVTIERERRWRRDEVLGKEEDEGKAEVS